MAKAIKKAAAKIEPPKPRKPRVKKVVPKVEAPVENPIEIINTANLPWYAKGWDFIKGLVSHVNSSPTMFMIGCAAVIIAFCMILNTCSSRTRIREKSDKAVAPYLKNIDSLKSENKRLQLDSLQNALRLDTLYSLVRAAEIEAAQKADDYSRSKDEGSNQRQTAQNQYNEIKKQIDNPNVDRRAILHQLLRSNSIVDSLIRQRN